MKTKTILWLLPLAALALIMGACDNDEVLDSENGWQGERVAMTFTAEIPQTRTLLSGYQVKWQAGDAISILALDESGNSVSNDRFTTGDAGFSAIFSGYAPEKNAYLAVYPYQEGVTGLGLNNKMKLEGMTLSSEQTARIGSFDPMQHFAFSYNSAEFSNTAFRFHSLCALVKFSIAGTDAEGVKKVTLDAGEGNALAAVGFSIVNDKSSSTALEATVSVENATSISSSVTLTAEEGFKTNTDYYFVVLPIGKLSQIKLTFAKENGTSITKTSKAGVELKANTILNLGEILLGEMPTPQLQYNDFLKAVEQVKSITFVKDAGNATVTLNEENWALVKSVETLDIYNKQLTDLSGIEYFTNLTYLRCSKNELESLDVNALSRLETLDCGTNMLTTLDVSDLTGLTRLSCGNNQLTTLDVSALTSLTTLACNDNQLTTLDVSMLKSLTQLNCYNNPLQGNLLGAFDLPKLKYLRCSNIGMTSLDVSKLPMLEELDCSNNKLANLNASSLTGLTSLNCNNNSLNSLDVKGLTKLKSLNCTNNQLTTLDASGLTNLSTLYCYGNASMTSLNVTGLSNLEKLECYRNQLTSLDVSDLTSLNRLYCYANRLDKLSIVNNPLIQFKCGNQTTNGSTVKKLQLTLTSEQKATWDSTWGQDRGFCENVDLYTPEGQPYNK